MSTVDARAVLLKLANPTLERAEAEALMASLDGHEAEAVLEAFRWLHDAQDEAALHGTVQLLAWWADRPVAQALPPALLAMLDEPGVGDLNRLAAADLLARLGQPVAPEALGARLSDPAALAQAALRSALAAVDEPLALVSFLDALAGEPQDLVLALIDDLATQDDPRAVAILAPLAQSADAEVAVSAVAALDELGADGAVDALLLVAAVHPDAMVREQADRTLATWVESGSFAAAAEGAEAYLSAPEAAGGHYVLLRRPETPPGKAGVLSLHCSPEGGITQYAAAEQVSDTTWQELVARLAADGHPIARVPAGEAAAVLAAAARRTLETGGALALGYAAWPWVLGPVPKAEP